VAVIERADGHSRASVRAPAGFDAIGAVTACADLLVRYGGHAGAAGFTIESELVPTFRERFVEAAERAGATAAPEKERFAECRLRAGTVDLPLLDVLARLGPFGEGCPEPLFETSDLSVREARVVGDGHLRLRLFGEGRVLTGICFGGGGDCPAVGARIDVLYRARPNVWKGQVRVDLQIVGWRPASI
jgi:single-stranded-DNA-specific exonuclease